MIDYFALFIIITLAIILSNLFILLIVSRSFARQAGFNFGKGQNEYRNEEEKQYMRKRV